MIVLEVTADSGLQDYRLIVLWLKKISYASMSKNELRGVASVRAVAARLFRPIGRCIRMRPIRLGPIQSGNVKDAVMKRCRNERRRQVRQNIEVSDKLQFVVVELRRTLP